MCVFENHLFVGQFFVDEEDHTDVGQDMKEVRSDALVQTPDTFIPHGLTHAVKGTRVVGVAILKAGTNNLKFYVLLVTLFSHKIVIQQVSEINKLVWISGTR